MDIPVTFITVMMNQDTNNDISEENKKVTFSIRATHTQDVVLWTVMGYSQHKKPHSKYIHIIQKPKTNRRKHSRNDNNFVIVDTPPWKYELPVCTCPLERYHIIDLVMAYCTLGPTVSNDIGQECNNLHTENWIWKRRLQPFVPAQICQSDAFDIRDHKYTGELPMIQEL